jgi:hypothetical protein
MGLVIYMGSIDGIVKHGVHGGGYISIFPIIGLLGVHLRSPSAVIPLFGGEHRLLRQFGRSLL